MDETRNVCAHVPAELVTWFDETFPALSKTGFIVSCFEALHKAYGEGSPIVSPEYERLVREAKQSRRSKR